MRLGGARIRNSFFTLEPNEKTLLSVNSFGLLRLILAITVLFQHSLVLSGNGQLVYFGYFKGADLGSTGVAGFFAISGFLLAGSAQRLSSQEYFIHRVFRLLPGLWFALAVSAFALVPLASLFGSSDSEFKLFLGKESSVTYVLLNMGLVVFQDSIGSVFSTNPYPLAVNGSLWTLAPEFICYVSLLGLAFFTRRKVVAQKFLLGIAIALACFVWLMSENSTNQSVSTIIHPAAGLGIAFATGSLLSFLANERPYRPSPLFALSLLVVWLLLGLSGPLAIISLAFIVVSLGLSLTHSAISRIGRKTDISYGIYLFHFPAIQAIILCAAIDWTPAASLIVLPVFALVLATPLAWVSWRFVELPSIKFARNAKQLLLP